jgi:hypothetical protein
LREERLAERPEDRAVRALEDAEREPHDLRPPRPEVPRELPFARALPFPRERPLEPEPEAAPRPRDPAPRRLEVPEPGRLEVPVPGRLEELAPPRLELPDRPALEPRRDALAPRLEPFDCAARAELPRLAAALLRRCFCSNVSG